MSQVEQTLHSVLAGFVGRMLAHSIVTFTAASSEVDLDRLSTENRTKLLEHIGVGLGLYLRDPVERRRCTEEIRAALDRGTPRPITIAPSEAQQIERVEIKDERDVITVRTTARQICISEGAIRPSQVRVVTVVSELARNIVQYAGTGYIELSLLRSKKPALLIKAVDNGPGIPNVEEVLSGNYISKTGLGLGLAGAKKLADALQIETGPHTGTTVSARMSLETGEAKPELRGRTTNMNMSGQSWKR